MLYRLFSPCDGVGRAYASNAARSIQTDGPNGTLVNVYGMTEGHGDCTAAVYSPLRPFDAANDRVAIGSAIIDFSLCVQDVETGRWVREPGESGELYLASSCVVPGYYKHSDGTVIADEKARTKFPAVTPNWG